MTAITTGTAGRLADLAATTGIHPDVLYEAAAEVLHVYRHVRTGDSGSPCAAMDWLTGNYGQTVAEYALTGSFMLDHELARYAVARAYRASMAARPVYWFM